MKNNLFPGARVVEVVYHVGTVVSVDEQNHTVLMQEGDRFRTVPLCNVDVIPQEVKTNEKF